MVVVRCVVSQTSIEHAYTIYHPPGTEQDAMYTGSTGSMTGSTGNYFVLAVGALSLVDTFWFSFLARSRGQDLPAQHLPLLSLL